MNMRQSEKQVQWKKLLIEFLYTKNQAGEPWSPEYGSNFENYYNHGEYVNGWSYLERGIGNPFISTAKEVKQGLPSGPQEYFINSRVLAVHCGFEGAVGAVNYTLKASWSENYGTYWTTDEEQSTGLTDPGAYVISNLQD